MNSVSSRADEKPRDEEPTPTAVVTPDPRAAGLGSAAALLAEEMAVAWRAGGRPTTEEMLARRPDLGTESEVVLRLICEEVCLREEAGEEVRPDELNRRFPRWQAEIVNLLDRRGHAPRRPTDAAAPVEFELLAELGQGAHGRVYLARQKALADRPVVLKVTAREGREHLSLARLQHTHIVPLYGVQDDPEHDRRTLCMPYFGTLTLAALLVTLRAKPVGRRSGQDVLAALDAACAESAVPLQARGPARLALARASYAQAVAWLGACLAEALGYAHERGLMHFDVKPSNILLAADGQPMLLDFHLAQAPLQAGARPRWGLGGTPLYMAPEQRAATSAVRQGRPLPAAVDGRADVYALGLVLYQALGGSLPLQFPRPPRLDRCNPQVSPGLADMVHKCLAEDPSARYPDAAALAADLRRHLSDLPLRGVANRSLAERWRKWRRRRPHTLFTVALLVLLLGGALAGGIWYTQDRRAHTRARLAEAEEALRQGQQLLGERQYLPALQRFQRGHELAVATPGGGELGRRLDAPLRRARGLESAEKLHRIADRVRFAAVSESLPARDLRELAEGCRELWQHRERILALQTESAAPKEELRQVQEDLLDVAVVWAELQRRLARKDAAADACQEALRILDEAEKAFGPSAVLLRERESLARALGDDGAAQEAAQRRRDRFPPRSAWELHALGRRLVQDGDLDEATAALERAVFLAPGEFWGHFYLGKCAFQRKQYAEAVTSFRICTALAPQSAPSYYNKGLAHERLGEDERAWVEYGRALDVDPNLTQAALNRALVRTRLELRQRK